ncbi:acyltransferase [Dechloromonas sp. XY25]|uniref:Acyltransferase n=1 Tax=Dechloromonas hankyongensis TaxID=2908002 RepID=A0ABS9K3W0_9RHOO|nr:acyltransferase [Dechloromonas hankyongensis]MCG2577760.1 acyltransferase [Dechloromonas hankyongensis]
MRADQEVVVGQSSTPTVRPRLDGLDALRGIAAMAVVLFHFTTQFDKLFGHESPPLLSFPLGHYGVNLFFIISGFVIFMTIERSKAPMDFVVSRFSRLYPAYWVAIALTFTITHWLGLPGHLADFRTALLNGLMFHGMAFRIPHVDGVYWTLEVELLFYAGMFVLMMTSRLRYVHGVLFALLAIRVIYFVALQFFGISLPWIIYRYLIIGQIAWFAIGMAIYRVTFHSKEKNSWLDWSAASAAVSVLAIVESPGIAGMAIVFGGLVWGAANGRLRLLANPFIVWLGAISYTLYLLHENIGWSVILSLREAGIGVNISILLAIAVSLILASLATYCVERPAMSKIRVWYRQAKARAAG